MKTYVMLALFMSLTALAEPPKRLGGEVIKGRVKNVKYFWADMEEQFGKGVRKKVELQSIQECDDKGRLKKYSFFWGDNGSLSNVGNYEYNAAGGYRAVHRSYDQRYNLPENMHLVIGSLYPVASPLMKLAVPFAVLFRTTVEISMVEKYDERGDLIERVDYPIKHIKESIKMGMSPPRGIIKTTRKYDIAKRKEIIETIDLDGMKLLEKQTTLYNSAGGVTERLSFDSSDKSLKKETYRYDEKSNLVEELEYDKAGDITGRITHNYFEDGKKRESLTYKSNGNVERRRTYTYHTNGKLSGEVDYWGIGSLLDGKTVTKYNEKGQEVESLNFQGTSKDIEERWVYAYDKRGNRVKGTRYEEQLGQKGKLSPTAERFWEIVYLD